MLEPAARLSLLVLGITLVVVGVVRGSIGGLAMIALGLSALFLSAVLPRVQNLRLFGHHGLEARLESTRVAERRLRSPKTRK